CQAQQQALTTYGWVDQHTGVVRVPVDQAMKTLLAHGLPVRAGSESAASITAAESHAAPGTPAAAIDAGPCGYLLQAEAAKTPADERGEKSGAPGAREKE